MTEKFVIFFIKGGTERVLHMTKIFVPIILSYWGLFDLKKKLQTRYIVDLGKHATR